MGEPLSIQFSPHILFAEGGGAMWPWTPQYPVRTQVVSRILFEPLGSLFEPLKTMFELRHEDYAKNNLLIIIDFKKKKIQKFKRAGIGNKILLALR